MAARIIDKGQAGTVDAWAFPPVKPESTAASRFATPAELRELERQTREAAERQGHAEGLEKARAEVAECVRRLSAIADALARPLDNVEQEVEQQLLGLAVALAAHVVRREIERDALPMVEAVRDCMAALPGATREAALHLHPADAAVVASHLQSGEQKLWKLVPDAALERGDVQLVSESSRIDGRLETRLREIVAAALAEREALPQ